MAPQPIHGISGVAELPYGRSPGSDTEMSDAVIPYPVSGCTPYIVGPMGQPGVYDYIIIHGESLKDYSYGNYSPSTVYDINGACYITATGYTADVGYSIPNSYGKLSGHYVCGRNIWFLSGESYLAKWLSFL